MNKFKKILIITLHGAYDTATPEGRANERARRIALTAVTAAIAKVFAMAIPLITVRITYNYLGAETYGLWNAITSFFTLFAFADFGLGNGLQTRLSQASGLDDESLCKRLISSTYAMLVLVAGCLMAAFLVAYPFVNWGSLMNAETERAMTLAGGVVFAIVASRLLSIPLSLVQRTQMALQEGYRSNLWQIVAYIFSLISVYIIAGLDLGPLTMIWTSAFIVVIVSGLNMLVYFRFQKKQYRPAIKFVDINISRSLIRTGSAFFVLSILTTIGLALDNFIVAKAISLSEAATYSILFKVTHMIGGITTMLSAPMWAANGEAFARGELDWIKQSTKKMSLILLGISTFASIGLLIIAKPFFRIWIGEQFEFSMLVLIGMCVMQILLSVITAYFMVLNALGIVRKQIVIFAVYTPISFVLKYMLAKSYGAVAIPWVGAFSYAIFIAIPVIEIVNKVYKTKTVSQV
ncbi:MAG: oligosaccharide flippase family protein [Tissierellia bacterium]|nr:oligosaccharide flippase family protein [Tissierellia bacterium]